MIRRALGIVVGVAALTAACSAKPSGGSNSPDASPAAPAIGLDAVGNDPAVVALVRNVMACPWPAPNATNPAFDCPAWRKWLDAADLRAAAPDITYVNIIEDPNPRIRRMGVDELELGKTAWTTDPVLARRVFAVVSKVPVDEEPFYGVALGKIDYTATGLWPTVKPFLEDPARRSLLISVLNTIVEGKKGNAHNEEIWSWQKGKLQSPDPLIADAAIGGFFESPRPADACVIFEDAMRSEILVQAAVTYATALGDDCLSSFDPALGQIETWVKSHKIPTVPTDIAQVLKRIATNKKAPDATKKHALADFELLATTTDALAPQRSAALNDLYAIDKARGTALATKLAHDKNADVAKAAKEIAAKGT